MPFRPLPPAQQPSILSSRSPTSPQLPASVPTLRLPTAPPVPPKPLYLSTRRVRGSAEAEDERSEGKIGGRKRAALPDRWSVVTADDEIESKLREVGAQGVRGVKKEEEEQVSEEDPEGVAEGTVRLPKGIDQANAIDRDGTNSTVTAAKSTLAALFILGDDLATSTSPSAPSRSPSTTSTTSRQTEMFRTPVGTLRAGSTIKFRSQDGRQSIYFDPSSTNPFFPTSSTPPLDPPACDDAGQPPEDEQNLAVVSPSNLPLLPLPSSTSPAIALHAFTGQPEFGELSFSQGASLFIEVEDVGGGWSLGFVESEGEEKRGLVPRGWYAYVDSPTRAPPLARDSPSPDLSLEDADAVRKVPQTNSESSACTRDSLAVDSSEPYATRSIGRHVVVIGTEFEPTWVVDKSVAGADEPTTKSELGELGKLLPTIAREVQLAPRDVGQSDEGARYNCDTSTSAPPNKDSPSNEVADRRGLSPLAIPPPATQSFLFRIGLAPFFDTSASTSAFSRFLPTLGRTPIPGASVLAATSAASSLAAAPPPAKPQLPRLESHRASTLPDGKTLLLRWVEEGDELDEAVDYGENGEGSVQCFDIDSGPAWRRRDPNTPDGPAQVYVSDPKKCSPLNESPFVVYTVTTSFTSAATEPDDDETASAHVLCVTRRYSHFAALHTLLASRFLAPLVQIPPLPPKGPLAFGAARFDPAFLERRRKELERWLRRCVRHPVLGESEEIKGFLAIEGEKELSAHLLISSPRPPPPLQPLFPARIFHPAFNLDLSEAEDICDRFERHCKAVELGGAVGAAAEAVRRAREQDRASANSLQHLSHAFIRLASGTALPPTSYDSTIPGLAAAEAGSVSSDPRARAKAWCLQNEAGALSWKEEDEPALGVSKAVQAAGEACADVATLRDMSARTGALDFEEELIALAAPLLQYAPLIDLHRSLISTYRRLARLSGTTSAASDQLARCETALNITAAEMDRIRLARTDDVAVAVRGWLETTISVHEQSLEHLRFALGHFSPSSLADLALTGPRLRSRLEAYTEALEFPPLPRAGVYDRGSGASAWR